MTYIIPPGFSRISFDYAAVSTVGSKPSWGVGVSIGPDNDVLLAAVSWAVDVLRPITSNAFRIDRVQMRNDIEMVEELTTITGSVTGPHGPPSNAALISLSTGLIGRANRGRVYLPGVLPEADLGSDGVIAGARVTAINNAFGELMTDLVALGAEPVILHSASSDPTPVNAWQTQAISATQRRRLRG